MILITKVYKLIINKLNRFLSASGKISIKLHKYLKLLTLKGLNNCEISLYIIIYL